MEKVVIIFMTNFETILGIHTPQNNSDSPLITRKSVDA